MFRADRNLNMNSLPKCSSPPKALSSISHNDNLALMTKHYLWQGLMRTDLSIVQGIKFSIFSRMFLYLNYMIMYKNVNENEK